eukprot:TRINITY_DN29637_c0_g2_i2.p13 TRINITY_DN29637_c0_g2~~TRINITY_DN29637_c0_g2_i2.p13  ORF type:complete len:103 (-),score=1.08 TRINITY_DN29637_c0_g2_i2:1780-2088(-)
MVCLYNQHPYQFINQILLQRDLRNFLSSLRQKNARQLFGISMKICLEKTTKLRLNVAKYENFLQWFLFAKTMQSTQYFVVSVVFLAKVFLPVWFLSELFVGM